MLLILKINFVFNYDMYMGMCTQVQLPMDVRRGNRCPRAGVIVRCELPYIGADNCPVVFRKSSIHL